MSLAQKIRALSTTRPGQPGPVLFPMSARDFRERAAALAAEQDALVASLVSALDRCATNYRLTLSGKPVRDVAEMFGEVDAALRAALLQGGQEGGNG